MMLQRAATSLASEGCTRLQAGMFGVNQLRAGWTTATSVGPQGRSTVVTENCSGLD